MSCKKCGLTRHLDGQHRVILTGAIRKSCKGAAISGSPPLPELFRQQAQKARDIQAANSARPAKDHTGTGKQDQRNSQTLHLGPGGPTPRRIHFDTAYDQQASGTRQAHHTRETMLQPEQAMNPSPHAGIPHEADAPQAEDTTAATDDHDREEDGEMTLTVDFF